MSLFQQISDAPTLKTAFSRIPSGLVAVAALAEGMPQGIVMSSFSAVSMNPPLVSICVQLTSSTWPKLRDAGTLGVSFLGEGQEEVCAQFAKPSDQRFDNIDWFADPEGAVFLEDASAWMRCSFAEGMRAGDHIIALMTVESAGWDGKRPPLIYLERSFRELAPVAS